MKKFIITLLITGLPVLMVPTSLAQSDEKDPERKAKREKQNKGGKGGGRDALFAVLDTDGDGSLSVKELNNALAVLQKLDRNGDGNLTPEEITPSRSGKGGRGGKGRNKPDKGKRQQ